MELFVVVAGWLGVVAAGTIMCWFVHGRSLRSSLGEALRYVLVIGLLAFLVL